MGKLTGKVAVVTGASKGIGAGIAKALGAEGASVVVNYASDKSGADKTVAEITKAGGKAIAVGASVAKSGDIEKLFAETKKSFGKVDILVNNAGVYAFTPARSGYRRRNQPHLRNQRHWPPAHHQGRGTAVPVGRRQRHQHRLRCQRDHAAQLVDLHRNQGCSRRHHPRPRQGTRTEEDSCQCRQPWPHAHRRPETAGIRRFRLREVGLVARLRSAALASPTTSPTSSPSLPPTTPAGSPARSFRPAADFVEKLTFHKSTETLAASIWSKPIHGEPCMGLATTTSNN